LLAEADIASDADIMWQTNRRVTCVQNLINRIHILSCTVLIFVIEAACSAKVPVNESLTMYTNASWWDGEKSYAGPMYEKNGIFVAGGDQQPGTTIDLDGAVVTAPFAEGHNHNLMEQLFDDANEAYLEQGVFYVKVPIIYPPAIDTVRAKLERPDTVDATFSMGGLTSKGGHPVSIFVNVLSGSVYEKLAYEDFAGMAFHEIDSLEKIDPALDVIEAQGGDFVKLFLLYAEDYEQPDFVQGRGLNPIFVRPIVESAHRRGLPVTAHVQSAYDFGIAVAAGVDEIAHLPGYYWREKYERYRHRITHAEAVATAAKGVAVVTSTLFPQGYADDERKALIRETQVANLRKLLDAGVELRIGSDIYDRKQTGEDRYATRSELLNLVELGVMDASMALATWIATGRAIFPERKIACFDPGCEASFLIFDHDPREDITELLRIRSAVKQGVEVGRKIKTRIADGTG